MGFVTVGRLAVHLSVDESVVALGGQRELLNDVEDDVVEMRVGPSVRCKIDRNTGAGEGGVLTNTLCALSALQGQKQLP